MLKLLPTLSVSIKDQWKSEQWLNKKRMSVSNLHFIPEKLINLIETVLFNIWKQFAYVSMGKRVEFIGSFVLLCSL